MGLANSFRQQFQRWAFRGRLPEPVPIMLSQKRVYVLPTPAGLAYLATLATMLLASINYSLSLGHALVFLLLGVGIAAILNTFKNLAHLHISTGRCPPVFAGTDALFGLVVTNPSRFGRYNLSLHAASGPTIQIDIPGSDSREAQIPVSTKRRGWLALPPVTLTTTYPLGLVRAWAYAMPNLRCLVYPAPALDAPPLPSGDGRGGGTLNRSPGNDDFAGFRRYVPGQAWQHVAWKSAARQPDAELLAKHFAGEAGATLWLNWHELPPSLDTEQCLSIMARWVVDAQNEGLTWGLDLPHCKLAPNTGIAHFHRCLAALALHGQ